MQIDTKKIVDDYCAGVSMKELGKAYRLSPQTIRRILIDAGAYANETTDYAMSRLEDGASLDQIASELGVTKNAVISNLPHSKGLYGLDDASANAKRIRACRQRKAAK